MEKQFLEWVGQYQARILNVCRFYTWEPEEQKDLYQEILLLVWKSMPRFREESSPGTWIYRIAVNTSLMFRRTAGRRKEDPILEKVEEPIAETSLESKMDQESELLALRKAISTLKELDQTLVMLYFEELPYQDIAAITGLSTTNVGARLSRIKKRLTTMLTPASHE